MNKSSLILLKRKFKKLGCENKYLCFVFKKLGILKYFGFPDGPVIRKAPACDYIFIRLHRVAGTSTAAALDIEKQHFTSREAINAIGKKAWDETFKFAMVRNPFSKLVSTYNHFPKNDRFQMKSNPIPFDVWIKKLFGDKKDPMYYFSVKFFQPQFDWLKDDNDKISLDRIVRHENLTEEFNQVLSAIGVNTRIPHLNQSKKVDYRNYYNEESYDLVKQWHKKDLDAFGYTFDNG